MPYDPRMLQMAQRGIGMMGPPQGDPFARNVQQPQQPKQWWDQPMPVASAQKPNDPNAPAGSAGGDPRLDAAGKQPQPSLLQMLMLGGKPTYSGTPRPGAANPWGWLGGLGGGYK